MELSLIGSCGCWQQRSNHRSNCNTGPTGGVTKVDNLICNLWSGYSSRSYPSCTDDSASPSEEENQSLSQQKEQVASQPETPEPEQKTGTKAKGTRLRYLIG